MFSRLKMVLKMVHIGILTRILLYLSLPVISFCSVAARRSADYGGNRGWALGFSEETQYASVKGYFDSESYWPTTEITGTL